MYIYIDGRARLYIDAHAFVSCVFGQEPRGRYEFGANNETCNCFVVHLQTHIFGLFRIVQPHTPCGDNIRGYSLLAQLSDYWTSMSDALTPQTTTGDRFMKN